MAKFQTLFATGRQIAPYDDSGDVVSVRVDFAVSAAMVDATGTARANFSANDVIEMVDLPPGHVPVDAILIADDIDTATGVSLSVGIINATDNGMSSDAADGGAAWIASSTIGQAGGVARPTTKALFRCTPLESSARRRIGVHVVAAPTTLQAGTITLIVLMRSSHYGV